MKWVELTVELDLEAVEPMAELLNRHVYGGVALERPVLSNELDTGPQPRFADTVRITGYVQAGRGWKRKLREIEVAASLLGQLRPVGPVHWRLIAEEDWSSAWKQHYHPLLIGERIIVKPSWEDFQLEPGQVLVELDPGMAFGTGLHPTTQLCLRQLERWVRPGMRALDLGTGSGILAIAAIRLGAGSVLALDTDGVAVEAATRNVAINGLQSSIEVRLGSLDHLFGNAATDSAASKGSQCARASEVFDLVVANILASVICDLAEGLVGCLESGGVLIAGGIINDKAAAVAETLRRAGLTVATVDSMGDWTTILGTR